MARYAFISRLGSVAYVAVTYDKNGGNLPSNIGGNKVEWSRIQTSHREVFSLLSTSDMERDLHEAQIHITETRTTRRSAYVQHSWPFTTLGSQLLQDAPNNPGTSLGMVPLYAARREGSQDGRLRARPVHSLRP